MEEEFKKKRKRNLYRMLLIMVLSGVLGVLASFLVLHTELEVLAFAKQMESMILTGVAYLFPVSGTIIVVLSFCLLRRGKKLFLSDEENFINFTKADRIVGLAIGIINFSFVINYVSFALASFYCIRHDIENHLYIYIFCFIVFMMSEVFLQRAAVDFMRKMYPNKNADVLSFRFNKEWFDGCDELEQMIIYKSSYQSFKITQVALCLMFMFVFALGLWFDTGALPVLVTGILWLVHVTSYQVSAQKLAKRKNEEMSGE